ncbi:transposase [Pikeienuella piscinae]|uniref:Transposase n=1 Tax=Pikeienuella piscinae TaxID=2748098 RepID=A0A7L5BVA6_9RHOB|nr:transposase [Pikeienuella piscinae]
MCDGDGKSLILLLTEGQVSDDRGAATVLPVLPDADVLIADRGCDSGWFRQALTGLGIEPCIPGRENRKQSVEYDQDRYKQRNKVERRVAQVLRLAWLAPSIVEAIASGAQPERLKAIILDEAYREVAMREGERTVSVPIAQAVVRALGVRHAGGERSHRRHHRAHRRRGARPDLSADM